MIGDAVKGCASDGLRQAKPLKNRHSGGHQSFPARLFPREITSFEKLDRETATPQHHRED
jgi:hypothetical protein